MCARRLQRPSANRLQRSRLGRQPTRLLWQRRRSIPTHRWRHDTGSRDVTAVDQWRGRIPPCQHRLPEPYRFCTNCRLHSAVTKSIGVPSVQTYCSETKRNTHTHTHTRLTALSPGLPRWAGTRKVTPIWILLKQETVSGSGISWAVCKSASRSRQEGHLACKKMCGGVLASGARCRLAYGPAD